MYLRTPPRYSRGQKRSLVSLRWLWLWILTPLVVIAGVQIYNNRETLGPPVHQALYGWVNSAGNSLATAMAPTLVPTQDPTERLGRAEADWRDGRIEAAIETYGRALDAIPNDVEAHYRTTLGLLMEGRLADALDTAERTVTADPFSSDAWAIRAMALDWNDRYGEAISSALRALELNPNNARAMAFLAEAYRDYNQPELALSTIQRAMEIDPDSFEVLRVRGLIAQLVEFDVVTARKYFEEAYALAPNMPYLAVDLARINYATQDFEGAIALLSDIVEANPNNSIALYQLGFFYYSGQGNYSQAAEMLSRCVEANPKSVDCYGLLGRVQISLDNTTVAIQSLKRAIDELGSRRPRHFLWLGRALVAQGNCIEAIPYLEKGLGLARDTGDSEAETAIQDNLASCQQPAPSEVTPEATAAPDA